MAFIYARISISRTSIHKCTTESMYLSIHFAIEHKSNVARVPSIIQLFIYLFISEKAVPNERMNE